MSYDISFMVDSEATGGEPLEVFESRNLTRNYYDLLRYLEIAHYLRPREKDAPVVRLRDCLAAFETAQITLQEMDDTQARSLIKGGGSWGSKTHLLSELGILIDRARRYPNLYLEAR